MHKVDFYRQHYTTYFEIYIFVELILVILFYLQVQLTVPTMTKGKEILALIDK